MKLVMIKLFIIGLFLCFGCSKSDAQKSSTKKPDFESNVVTGDIARSIKKHISDMSNSGNGYFKIKFREKELALKLVRIHLEYLATLGPTSHFACVDLAGQDGEFYDVDFFLEGDKHGMKVTKTMVHKINGKPLYMWEQQADKSWDTKSVDNASHQLLGAIKGKDKFEFQYKAILPKITNTSNIWIPIASSDDFQTVKIKSMQLPNKHRILKDKKHGNKIIYMKLYPKHSAKEIKIIYSVTRLEKAAYKDSSNPDDYLAPDIMVPDHEEFKKQALTITKDKEGTLQKARAIYDHIIDKMRYMKYGEGWGKGDALYACNALYGNCTDFHSFFIALSRAIAIPARFAIGAGIPSERDQGGVDGYHCWAEFFAEGKWWPVDISEADKYTELSIYFFGHHPANRIEFSRGRDLIVDPAPESGPVNFLAYPLLEVDGKKVKTKNFFSFRRV